MDNKRIHLIWIAILFCLVNGNSSYAQTKTSGKVGALSWTYDTGTLTLSGKGDMPEFNWLYEPPWKGLKSNIKTVVVKEGVTSISDEAFKEANLTTLTLPVGLRRIGNSAFTSCGNLTAVKFQTGLIEIGDNAFSSCSKLTTVTLPAGLKEIGDKAFNACKALTSINFPTGVSRIGNDAFSSCSKLTTIMLPAGLKKLGGGSFAYCWELTSVSIPADVDTVGDCPFISTKLASVSVEKGNTNYVSINGVLLDRSKKSLIQYPAGSSNKVYVLPPEVTRIGYCAFYGAHNLVSVTLPAGLKEIGGWSFMYCGMPSITIPSMVEKLGNAPFSLCKNLSQIIVESGNTHYTSVDGVLFNKAKTFLIQYPNGNKRSTYDVPSGVTTIGYSAFWGNSALMSITLPAKLTTIENSAFEDCSGLKSIIVKSKNPPAVDGSSFNGIKLSEVTLYIPKGSRAAYATAPVWKEFKQIVESTVANIVLPEARIYTTKGRLCLSLPHTVLTQVYNLSGGLVHTFRASAGDNSVPLAAGVYIIRAGEYTQKIVVN